MKRSKKQDGGLNSISELKSVRILRFSGYRVSGYRNLTNQNLKTGSHSKTGRKHFWYSSCRTIRFPLRKSVQSKKEKSFASHLVSTSIEKPYWKSNWLLVFEWYFLYCKQTFFINILPFNFRSGLGT
jgi:hypothetical protein